MSKKKIKANVYCHASELLKEKGFVIPIGLLVKMNRLT